MGTVKTTRERTFISLVEAEAQRGDVDAAKLKQAFLELSPKERVSAVDQLLNHKDEFVRPIGEFLRSKAPDPDEFERQLLAKQAEATRAKQVKAAMRAAASAPAAPKATRD
jgi:hypothetical protein